MDRLSALTFVFALASVGCGKGDKDRAGAQPKPASRSRVNAVIAKEGPKGEEPAAFCDQWVDAASAKPFALPELAAPAPASPKGTNWRWVNVWATWCKPCVEELPRLASWEERFEKDGVSIDMVYLSVDEDDEVVETFRSKHPGTPQTLRIADADQSPDWLVSLGLDENAALPVHLFVDPQNRVRCVRTGGVSDHDYPTIGRVVKG